MQSKVCQFPDTKETRLTCYTDRHRLHDTHFSLFMSFNIFTYHLKMLNLTSENVASIMAVLFGYCSHIRVITFSVFHLSCVLTLWLFVYHHSRPSQAVCRGSRWPPAAAATTACLPHTVTARARWLLGCKNQRRWTSVQRVSEVSLLVLGTNMISWNCGLNQVTGLMISGNPERRFDDHFLPHNTDCICTHVGVNFIFRACTMPVQPDRAEPVIAKSGDSTKDAVSAQLH